MFGLLETWPSFRCGKREAGAPDRFLVPVAEGYVLVFESNHAVDREASTGRAINWRQVTRVKLLEVRFNG